MGGAQAVGFGSRQAARIAKGAVAVEQLSLEILDAAEVLQDLRIPPSNRLEKLSGDRKGQYSIRINAQWRICFEWRDGHAYDVEIVDYH